MWNGIEHLADPLETLGFVRDPLAPGGSLIVRTGNIGSWTFEQGEANWWARFCDHRFYFSADTLRLTLEKAGFVLRDVQDFEASEGLNKKKGKDISKTSVTEGRTDSLELMPGSLLSTCGVHLHEGTGSRLSPGVSQNTGASHTAGQPPSAS